MLSKIIHFSIRNKLVIAVATIALIIWGVWSAYQLPVDAVPDITNNQVQVITLSPTLASQEVEQFVTYPIEQTLANLPDIEEIRSISRFGLSVITVVFHDDVNIYFARQLITERLKEAEEQIPEGMGKPELAPVSTGLGEIYQYIIHPVKGSENKYSAMDLRTMQDWIVARQLYGTPGVAEVNSFGGELKQYEVAVNPNRLNAMNVTIPEIFNALQKNNQNTGGAYIDKKPNAYFIRSIGLVSSLQDVENIAIKTSAPGVPVLIRDVAEVKFGHAVKFGALTYNGEKEAVGGIVMMLKGANSADVVARVKEKMQTIKSSLPNDVEIEAYLDRQDLVDRAISTVKTNLVEGALIVIFVLILFLGNLRAGLIVASAIPLSMLFALGMMRLFGVSANLMSLGAIDFGLIVDGAVIIVEATLHFLAGKKINSKLSRSEMDEAVEESAKKMMNSAAFGQVIILIVYLPILSLRGIEGKMFGPMAQTVSFAILGALLLSLTYIPMMSAVFLSRKSEKRKNISDKIMALLERLYSPVINGAIKIKYWVVGIAILLLAISLFTFSRMGGEFLPQLQEGDFAFHCILPQGSSLSQSIETSMQAQKIIKSFPEVKTVVGKTGSAEIPTDPMPMEGTDLIITLKPMKEWTTTKDYNKLANMMIEKLGNMPGVFFESSQPIQMRFNELMTGVRQDVAIKIFGENVDTLALLAKKVVKVIRPVKGISSPQIEKTTGLPQITVQYDRARLANYKLDIEDVNKTISAAFAGETAGVVFENERKFDLVVRLDNEFRSTIEDVKNLFIATPAGNQVPLSQVAKIEFKDGPAQISREEGKRRIVIGFNVKGRDVESVVDEIQKKLAVTGNKLPSGYYLTYGGTFENLNEASARLRIAVPFALLLIFALLYFAFHSVKLATLIYTAIPMSAIGGVFALLLRDMPFSISAGVGFIALFGVAVLNGIVLISTFNQLLEEGVEDVTERVIRGTKMRMRPVLMTATVASLGFLPMAISTGAGAEVQKPLATVVIGGLITATLLTLVVLPCLYILFSGKKKLKMKSIPTIILFLILLLGISMNSKSQQRITINAAIDSALNNNLRVKINHSEIKVAELNSKTAKEIPKTGFFAENEDYHPGDKKGVLKIGVSQELAWPGLQKARKGYYIQQLKYQQLNFATLRLEITRDVMQQYFELWYLQDKQKLYSQLDSIYSSLYDAAALRYKTGEAAGIDQIAAHAKLKELQAISLQNKKDFRIKQQELMLLMNTRNEILPLEKDLEKLNPAPIAENSNHALLAPQQQNIQIAEAHVEVQKKLNMPEFSGRFFSQRLWGAPDPYTGFSITAAIPLLGRGYYKNKVKAANTQKEIEQNKLNWQLAQLNADRITAIEEVERNGTMLQFYETTGLEQSTAIIKAAMLGYRSGEISFAELSQYLGQAIETRQNYLDVLNRYNQAVIRSNYLNQ
ncbi:MAG: CusA/CzcA family heavy metal efflux RND transporter [Chitinophagaceae bacterium]|nr:CusA/CzcA family heavy metal efflux RND transporter [Bacteroidota bacterium]MCC6257920.1 CusA/CzcA family heavy metal efflux RND transporter [Chitinophagaceae bacterium]